MAAAVLICLTIQVSAVKSSVWFARSLLIREIDPKAASLVYQATCYLFAILTLLAAAVRSWLRATRCDFLRVFPAHNAHCVAVHRRTLWRFLRCCGQYLRTPQQHSHNSPARSPSSVASGFFLITISHKMDLFGWAGRGPSESYPTAPSHLLYSGRHYASTATCPGPLTSHLFRGLSMG